MISGRADPPDEPAAYMYLVEALCQLVERRNIDRASLLAGTGLTLAQVADPTHRITEALLKCVFRRAVLLVDDRTMGLELGAILSIRSYGFWGYAAMASSTLRVAASDVLERYHRAFSPFDIKVHVDEGTVIIQSDERSPWGDALPVIVEAGVLSFTHVLEHLAGGPLAELEVRLPFAEEPHHRVLRSMVQAVLRFDCASLQFRFAASELDKPIKSADPTLARLASAHCENELRAVRDEASLEVRVRRRMIALVAEGAPLERVADDLHMSARTLRRRLEALGTSYQDLFDRTRRSLAIEYVLESDRVVDDIGRMLGYGDDSNFRRAFRRWTGTTPAAYRAAHRRPSAKD